MRQDFLKKMLKGFMMELKLRGLSKHTLEAYEYANSRFLETTGKEPKYVTREDIKRYLNDMIDNNMKPKTINLNIAALKRFYDDFMGRRLFSRIKRVKLEKNMPNVISRQEMADMINNMKNKKHRLILKFLYSTGARAGELVKARIRDIDLENCFVRIISGKGKKDRLTIISEALCRDIADYIKDKPGQEFLFQNNRGSHLTIRAVEEIVKKASALAGIRRRVYPHAFRASFATHLYEDGIQIQKIQKLMGHSDFKTTLGYAKTAIVGIANIENPLDKIAAA